MTEPPTQKTRWDQSGRLDLEGIVAKRLADSYGPRIKWFKGAKPELFAKSGSGRAVRVPSKGVCLNFLNQRAGATIAGAAAATPAADRPAAACRARRRAPPLGPAARSSPAPRRGTRPRAS